MKFSLLKNSCHPKRIMIEFSTELRLSPFICMQLLLLKKNLYPSFVVFRAHVRDVCLAHRGISHLYRILLFMFPLGIF